jgi:hypothetical protein
LEEALTHFTKWAGHAVKQSGWRLDPRAALAGLALVAGLALLAAFYLALSSETAGLGRRLQEMEEEKQMLLQENAYLSDKIAQMASVAVMRQRALAARFVTTESVLFVPITPSETGGDELAPP